MVRPRYHAAQLRDVFICSEQLQSTHPQRPECWTQRQHHRRDCDQRVEFIPDRMDEELIANPGTVCAKVLPPQVIPERRGEWRARPQVLFQVLPLRCELCYRAVTCSSLNAQHSASSRRHTSSRPRARRNDTPQVQWQLALTLLC